MQREDWKNVGISQSYTKKSNVDPPFWIKPPFGLIWQHMLSIHVPDENITHCKKHKRNYWKMPKLSSFEFRPLSWKSYAILNQTKKIFYETCPTWIQAQIQKQNAKMFKTHWVIVEKPVFSHLENHRHFENLWKKLPDFYKCWSRITKCGKFWITILLNLFWNSPEKISRWRPISNFSSKIDGTENLTRQ
jgi:hypothetical protein